MLNYDVVVLRYVGKKPNGKDSVMNFSLLLESPQVISMTRNASMAIENPWVLATVAGTVFGIWPYALDKAGLVGMNSPTAFCQIQTMFLLFVLLLVRGIKGGDWYSGLIIVPLILVMGFSSWLLWETKTANWNKLLQASFCSGMGLICLSEMLARATNETRSPLLATVGIVSVVVGVSVYLLQTFWQNPKEFEPRRLLAYPSAALTIYLFYKKW